MTTYAIGDVQGCFTELQALLTYIHFDQHQDTLWFTGDLVNRGSQSLAVLRFVRDLGERHQVVLGNHDLHLLALTYGIGTAHREDTLTQVLNAPDCKELMDWLRTRPLLYEDRQTGYVMVHAGLAPVWTLAVARALAREVEEALQGDDPTGFLRHLYGNFPDQWDDQLIGTDRLRCITNYFTRMRFCDVDGRLDLTYKGEIAGKPAGLIPWFAVKNRANAKEKIIFGHWAALNGKAPLPFLFPLDTGCVWGNCLTAMRLEDGQRFSVKC